MQIKIDQTKCIGCGTCCALCSDYFDLDNNSKAILKNSATPAKDELSVEKADCPREAAECCPAQCIEIKNVK